MAIIFHTCHVEFYVDFSYTKFVMTVELHSRKPKAGSCDTHVTQWEFKDAQEPCTWGLWVSFNSFFHVLQLLPIRFTQQKSCCIGKSTTKHLQKLIENRTPSPYLITVIWKSVFVDFSTWCINPPNCVPYWQCRLFINIRRCRPMYHRHVSSRDWLFDPHLTADQSNLGVTLRKRAS